QLAPEGSRDLAQRLDGRRVTAALQPGDRRLGRPYPGRQRLLGEVVVHAKPDDLAGQLLVGRQPLLLGAVGGAPFGSFPAGFGGASSDGTSSGHAPPGTQIANIPVVVSV